MRIRAFLLTILMSSAPVASAQTGAVRVTPEQLRRIAALPDSFTVLRRAGADNVVSARGDVMLWPGDLVVGVDTTAVPTRSVVDTSRLVLPIRGYHVPVPGVAHDFQVIVERHAGLQYDPAASAYTGQIFVGLEDVEHVGEETDLIVPLQLQLFGPAGIDPGLLPLDHTDIPLVPVTLVSRSAADSVEVRARLRGQPAVAFAVPVNRFPLELRAGAEKVDGFGIGTVTLTVSFPTGFAGDSVPVTIGGQRVTPEPNRIMLSRGLPATVTVRSAGTGTETFTVTGPHFTAPATASVNFALPLGFALAALLGGGLGAWGRVLMRRRTDAPETHRDAAGRNIASGLIAGVFVAVAYAVGVNVLDVDVSGPPVEAVIFLLSGLGAFAGIEILSRLVPPLERALGSG